MARKHLGDELDIHTGGEDNVFPHHECEIAQSEAFTGRPFARFWMHAKSLQVAGGKMSKSLGNVWNLDDVTERGFTPRVLRYALIHGHYRGPLNFTWGIVEEARSALEKLDEPRRRFREAMDDDLNVPQALSSVFELRSALRASGLGREAAADAQAFLELVHRGIGAPSAWLPEKSAVSHRGRALGALLARLPRPLVERA